MVTPLWPFGEQAAIAYLRELLLSRDLPYYLRWFRHSKRSVKTGEINALAVARFLVEERNMWGDEATAIQVKDTITRALTVEPRRGLLSPETLTKFIDGFEMDEEHQHELWRRLAGVEPESAEPVSGQLTVRALDKLRPSQPSRHRTVSLHEFHYIGSDGLPERHTTIQVVRALVDGFDRYPYRFDTDHATVKVSRGGHALDMVPAPDDNQLYAVDILLPHPLQKDETVSLQYDTVFSYDPSDPPPREFRRATTGRTENLEMYLQFDSNRRPQRVWWAEWDDYRDGAQILNQMPVELEADLSAHRYLSYIEQTVIGFYWDWNE